MRTYVNICIYETFEKKFKKCNNDNTYLYVCVDLSKFSK